MGLYTDTDAPSVDPGVLARLQRLDKKLAVTFSKFAVDQLTSLPLIVFPQPDWQDYEDMNKVLRRGSDHYLLDPAFHLWAQDPDGRWHLVNSYPVEAGFGHREVCKLEADVARTMRPSDILARVHAAIQDNQEKEKRDDRALRNDVVAENESRISDLLIHGKSGRRQAKIVSYPGQVNRSTPGDVLVDAKEDGWVKPEQKD